MSLNFLEKFLDCLECSLERYAPSILATVIRVKGKQSVWVLEDEIQMSKLMIFSNICLYFSATLLYFKKGLEHGRNWFVSSTNPDDECWNILFCRIYNGNFVFVKVLCHINKYTYKYMYYSLFAKWNITSHNHSILVHK